MAAPGIPAEDRGPARIMATELPKAYEPSTVEERMVEFWQKGGYFRAERRAESKGPFCIVIPPPNAYYALHMGHALDMVVQDAIIRWKRMQGYDALWLPGTDHAGIGAEVVLERQLAEQGLTKPVLGREKFVEALWKNTREAHDRIVGQLNRLGCSCDWTRERFTLDQGYVRAVRKVFVALGKEGLIYKGQRIVNWCPRCATTLSDLEVEHEEEEGRLWYIDYPGEGGGPGVTVATTRPETMLGDTGVAVHPEDERWQATVGKTVILPLMERPIPVIADDAVEREMGTGAVKVTPAHDAADFEIGERQGLPQVVVIGADGCMTAEAKQYAGLDRYECRERVLEDLKARGLLRKEEIHRHSVGHCWRCKTTVEPLLSTQWFVRMESLARLGMEAVERGLVRITPERWRRVYLDWLAAVRDWPISRQLWWGHPLWAWQCRKCGEWTFSEEDPVACGHCGADELVQEEGVLDTWFSSALWPFATLGWPDDTEDLRYFYPTSVLVTGYDILFFWVARMIFSGMKFTGREPFEEVFLHGLVRDERGRKMTKSEGNVIDPLDWVESYGADALRFALLSGLAHGQDLPMGEQRAVGARNFCNKLWNAARLVLMRSGDQRVPAEAPEPRSLAERWILSRCRATIEAVTAGLEGYRFDEAAWAVYSFVWHEFCDWYLEIAKADLQAEEDHRRARVLQTAHYVVRTALGLLHPFIPFLTEQVWHSLRQHTDLPESLSVARWPEGRELARDEQVEEAMTALMAVVRAVRNVRSDLGFGGAVKLEVELALEGTPLDAWRGEVADAVERLAGAGAVAFAEKGQEAAEGAIVEEAGGVAVRVVVPARPEEFEKMLGGAQGVVEKLAKQLAETEERLRDEAFVSRAAEQAIARQRRRRDDLEEQLGRARRRVELLQRLGAR